MELDAERVKASLTSLAQAVKTDLKKKFGTHSCPQDALRSLSRLLFGLSPNEIRTRHGLPAHIKADIVAIEAIDGLLARRPLTIEVVLRSIYELPSVKPSSQHKAAETFSSLQVEGMLRFMHLARSSMKHGKARLTPPAIVSELQSQYVTRSEVAKFSDKSFYRSREWKELRLAVLSANPKCTLCGSGPETSPLHVDHIKPRSLWPELSLSPSNMQTLCGPCNLAKSNVIAMRY